MRWHTRDLVRAALNPKGLPVEKLLETFQFHFPSAYKLPIAYGTLGRPNSQEAAGAAGCK